MSDGWMCHQRKEDSMIVQNLGRRHIKIKDLETNEVFTIDSVRNYEEFVTRDGIKVKVYPVFIKLLVGRGQSFSGVTVLGSREMVKL